MSIRQLVEDARALAENGRTLGAFTLLIAMIGASARLRYPQPIGDAKAYKDFLRQELVRMTTGEHLSSRSLMSFNLNGESTTFEHVIYKYYRCELIHEGKLKTGFVFEDSQSDRPSLTVKTNSNGDLVLDAGLIPYFDYLIKSCKENRVAFGFTEQRAIPNDGRSYQDVYQKFATKFALRAPSAMPALLRIWMDMDRTAFDRTNEEILRSVKLAFTTEATPITGDNYLRAHKLSTGPLDTTGSLTDNAISLFKCINQSFKIVED
jgi:hypothetical protein